MKSGKIVSVIEERRQVFGKDRLQWGLLVCIYLNDISLYLCNTSQTMCSGSQSWTTTHISGARPHKHWFEVFTLSFSLVLMLFLEFINPLLYSEMLF